MIWPKAYRHNVAESLAALAVCEGRDLGPASGERRFLKFGRLLLSEDYLGARLGRDAARKADGVLRLATGRPAAFWKSAQLFASTNHAPSRADIILLKNNIRAFYPAENRSLKISNPNEPGGAARISNEVDVRRALRPSHGFAVPPVATSGHAGESAFLSEEIIVGAGSLKKVDANLVRDFIGFQKANYLEPLRPDMPRDLASTLIGSLGAHDIAVPPQVSGWLANLQDDTLDSEPWCLTNGDLSRTNILLKDGGRLVIDWEFGGAAPVTLDAIRLATQFSAFADWYVAAWDHPHASSWFAAGCVRAAIEHAKRAAGLSENTHAVAVNEKTSRKIRDIMQTAEEYIVRHGLAVCRGF